MDMQSKAKKLIEMIQTAPVEWKPLGEVLVRTKGTKITAGQMKEMHKDNAPLKIFAGGKTFALVDFDDVPDKDIHREPSIIVKSRGIIEFEYYDKPFSHKNEMWSYHSVNKHIYIKYVYYFLKTQENYFRNIGSKMQMPQIATPDTDNYKIPIPSLETQQKIVKILDKFTKLEATLEATLEAELALRKRQYRYYRDFLLDFDNQIGGMIADDYKGRLKDVVWKTLGEVAKIQRGASPRPISNYIIQNGDGIPWIKIGDTSLNSKYIEKTEQKISYEGALKSRILEEGDFVISNSMSYGRPYILKIKGAIHDGWASISGFKKELNPDFLYHYLSSNDVQHYWKSKINSSSVSNLNVDIIKTLIIPIPPLAEQEKITAILDKFDTLTNSVSEGLPQEIALRRKQYEYYRKQLLAFPAAA